MNINSRILNDHATNNETTIATNSKINNSRVNVATKSISTNDNITSRNISIASAESNQSVGFTPDEFITALNSGNLPSKSIVVTDNVELRDSNINYLPNNLTIKGKLKIYSCNNLTQMPSRLQVDDLSIMECDNLTELAEDIIIKQELSLILCNKLSKMPQNLVVDELMVSNCKEISLHHDMKVNKMLDISKCPKIIVLPQLAENIEFIYLKGFEIIMLEAGITIGQLYVCYCNIAFLPEGMTIRGNLSIEDCPSLVALPNILEVHGDIKIANCLALTALPAVWFSDVPSSLPFSDNNFHEIRIADTVISTATMDNYNNLLPAKINVFDPKIKDTLINEKKLTNQLIRKWQNMADNKNNIYIKNITTAEYKDLYKFLQALTKVPDYFNEVTKNNLANTVVTILQLIATKNKMQEDILFIIHDAVSECEDRVLLSLADIEFLPLLQKAEEDSVTDIQGKSLKELGKQKLYANEIINYAKIQANNKGSGKEEVEFILAYKIKLADKFNLNFTPKAMKHPGLLNITDNDAKLAYDLINAKITDLYFEQWLTKWTPWQSHERRWLLKKYADLTIASELDIKSTDLCVISLKNLDEITDLVIYKQQIYSYKSLCEWYITKGTNPLNPDKIIDINNIFAVEIPKDNPNIFYKKKQGN